MKKEFTLLDIFSMGIDYGQLIDEEERDSEEMFDAFIGVQTAKKYAMPSNPAQRRQARSVKWRSAKKKSFEQFLEIYANNHKLKINK